MPEAGASVRRAYGPDSSATALRGALAASVDGLEGELTADGALVPLDDPYLPLGTDLEGFARERTAHKLGRARLRDRAVRMTAEAPLFVDDLLVAAPPDVVLQLKVKAHRSAVETPAALAKEAAAVAVRAGSRRCSAAHQAAAAGSAGHACSTAVVAWVQRVRYARR